MPEYCQLSSRLKVYPQDLVFTVLWDAALKLKREKYLLAQDRVTYLGHIIDNKGLHPGKKKLMIFTRHLNLKMCLNYNISLVSYIITTHLSLTYLLSWLHSMNYSEKIHLGNGVKSNQRRSHNAKPCYIVIVFWCLHVMLPLKALVAFFHIL